MMAGSIGRAARLAGLVLLFALVLGVPTAVGPTARAAGLPGPTPALGAEAAAATAALAAISPAAVGPLVTGMLIDTSGSLNTSDPEGRVASALRLLIELSRPGRIAVGEINGLETIDQYAGIRLVGPLDLSNDADYRSALAIQADEARRAASHTYSGATPLAAAIRAMYERLDSAGASAASPIYLATDGTPDPDSPPGSQYRVIASYLADRQSKGMPSYRLVCLALWTPQFDPGPDARSAFAKLCRDSGGSYAAVNNADGFLEAAARAVEVYGNLQGAAEQTAAVGGSGFAQLAQPLDGSEAYLYALAVGTTGSSVTFQTPAPVAGALPVADRNFGLLVLRAPGDSRLPRGDLRVLVQAAPGTTVKLLTWLSSTYEVTLAQPAPGTTVPAGLPSLLAVSIAPRGASPGPLPDGRVEVLLEDNASGAASQPSVLLADDGRNGDVTAGDGIFSREVNLLAQPAGVTAEIVGYVGGKPLPKVRAPIDVEPFPALAPVAANAVEAAPGSHVEPIVARWLLEGVPGPAASIQRIDVTWSIGGKPVGAPGIAGQLVGDGNVSCPLDVTGATFEGLSPENPHDFDLTADVTAVATYRGTAYRVHLPVAVRLTVRRPRDAFETAALIASTAYRGALANSLALTLGLLGAVAVWWVRRGVAQPSRLALEVEPVHGAAPTSVRRSVPLWRRVFRLPGARVWLRVDGLGRGLRASLDRSGDLWLRFDKRGAFLDQKDLRRPRRVRDGSELVRPDGSVLRLHLRASRRPRDPRS